MKVYTIKTAFDKDPRFIYTIEAINNHPFTIGADTRFEISGEEETTICYGSAKEDEASYYIPKSDYIFKNSTKRPVANFYKEGDSTLYSVEQELKPSAPFISNRIFGFDLLETIFFHLSRYEELTHKFVDHIEDRLAFERKLLLVENGLEKVPVVDDLVAAFLEKLTNKKIEKKRPVYLSHDIDYIRKFKSPMSIFRKIAGHIRHRKSISGFPFLWQTYLDYLFKGKDGFDTFEWMLSEREMDKTIYFLVGGEHREDNQYDLKGEIFKRALNLAKSRDYHIGIHPSYHSWNQIDLIRTQKSKLEDVVEKEITVSRQHFLNFDIAQTPKMLQRLGISEDASLGYTRHVGYRCGTGFPYLLYDFESEKAFDVVEKPLVFMDVAWLFEAIRKDDFNLPDLLDFYGGFNFHNSTFDEMGARGIKMKEHYIKFFG